MNEAPTQSLITSEEIDQSVSRRGWFKRTFSPLSEGSLRGIIFGLLASAMGTGIFNLPLRCQEIGILSFIVFAVVTGAFSAIGSLLISRLIIQKKFESYSDMAGKAGGKGLMGISNFCLIFYAWGITICFQVILAKFVIQLLNDVGGINLYEDRKNELYNQTGNSVRILTNLIAITLAIPLIMKKDVNILQKLGLVAVVAVIFNFIVIIITTVTGFDRKIDGQILHYGGIFHLQKGQINWISDNNLQSLSKQVQGFSSILFCYVNQQLLFPLAVSLKRPSQKRFNKIIVREHAVQFLVYLIMGITAYLLLMEHADKYPIAPMVIVSIPTTLVTVGKIAMCLALFIAVCLNMFPAREGIFEALSLEKTNLNHTVVCFLLMASSCGVAVTFQAVNSYFGLLGGTAGVLLGGTLPGICYAKLKQQLTLGEKLCMILIGIVTLIGFSGAALSVIDPS